MEKVLEALYRRHTWATLKILNFVADLDEEAWAATSKGAFGSIRDTLVHCVSGERRYASHFATLSSADVHERLPFPGFEGLIASATETGAVWLKVAATAGEDWEIKSIEDGKPWLNRASTILAQVLHHADEHRTQVCTVLGERGVEPPDLSAWAYEVEMSYGDG
ncbi:MAG: DinB family protein [Dehalococcoidia bacterium]